MKKLLAKGTIVTILTADYNFVFCIITEHNAIYKTSNVTKMFDYRAIHAKAGFRGVDTYFEFNHEEIFQINYQPLQNPVTGTTLEVSGIISFNNVEYLVIGKNEGFLNCLNLEQNSSFAITNIAEEENYQIIDSGYQIHDNSEQLSEKLLLHTQLFLPVGSVVEIQIEDEPIEIMIIGRLIERDEQQYHYMGISSFTGYQSMEQTILFNRENIYDVLHTGHFNEEEYFVHKELLVQAQFIEELQ